MACFVFFVSFGSIRKIFLWASQMVNSRKRFLVISAVFSFIAISVVWLFGYSWEIDIENKDNKDKAQFEKKLNQYEAQIYEDAVSIEALRQQTEKLKEEDKNIDEQLDLVDEKMGLSKEQFDEEYPEFDMNGTYE